MPSTPSSIPSQCQTLPIPHLQKEPPHENSTTTLLPPLFPHLQNLPTTSNKQTNHNPHPLPSPPPKLQPKPPSPTTSNPTKAQHSTSQHNTAQHKHNTKYEPQTRTREKETTDLGALHGGVAEVLAKRVESGSSGSGEGEMNKRSGKSGLVSSHHLVINNVQILIIRACESVPCHSMPFHQV
ncbi:hypothetical protein EYC84_004274 [Monilinia fructicola]|uniref:Uncharacterized protein n=1 Tax=Monilinia fructicola TaxID=38448 RepID=A0A5M9K872_MONFR|nr:hypothetical protein EYC84_004274 [Monilinia fructicola]